MGWSCTQRRSNTYSVSGWELVPRPHKKSGLWGQAAWLQVFLILYLRVLICSPHRLAVGDKMRGFMQGA